MNCLEARRALFAGTRRPDAPLEDHLGGCPACSGLGVELSELDHRIAEAAAVPPPDALADRILLARRPSAARWYAAAASLVAATLLTAILAGDVEDPPFTGGAAEVVAPGHPAVAAISEVAEDIPRAPVPEADAARELEQVLNRLGLALRKGDVTAQYVGKCTVNVAACDHIVLSTREAQANVLLMANYPLGQRVLVTDGRMSALVSPVRTGGYIVVADTPRNAKRMARLLVRG